MPSRRLLLVDGTAVLYRSYFAIKHLSTRAGRPTNAVYGFIRLLRQLRQQWSPTHWGVVFDGGVPEWRLTLWPAYKAQRPPMPEGLREQFAPAAEYLERAGITMLRLDRQEADDVLASLAVWGNAARAEVLIATSDKDLYQVVGDGVSLVAPERSGARVGAEEVRARTGVLPPQIVDWLALSGDAVDNIPGVEGLGPKTAAKLLNAYGSLAELWERLSTVEPERLRQRLAAARDRVETNVKLIGLRTDLDCAPGWDALETRPEDLRRLQPFFESMEFRSLMKAEDQPTLL